MEDELIPYCKLTKRQKQVLQLLKDGEELVFEEGAGWWLGTDRVHGKLPKKLLIHMTLKLDQFSRDDFQRYSINETGEKSLESGWLYMHPKLRI